MKEVAHRTLPLYNNPPRLSTPCTLLCLTSLLLSYEVALGQYEERVAAGLQPSTRLVDLYSVGVEEILLVSVNFLYLGLVILLYLRMLVRPNGNGKKSARLKLFHSDR